MSEKRKVVRLTFIRVLSVLFIRVFKLPINILVARILGAAGLGVVKTIGLIQTYVSYNHLGLNQMLSRQLPIVIAKKDSFEEKNIRDIIFTSTYLTTLLALIIVWGMYLSGITINGTLTTPRLSILTLSILVARLDSYCYGVLKGVGDYTTLTRRDVMMSWFSLIITLPLVIIFKIEGMLVAMVLVPLGGVCVSLKSGKILKPELRLIGHKVWEYLRIGSQIFIVNISDNIFASIDLTVIAIMLVPKFVGYYALPLEALAFAASLLGTFHWLFYRDMLKLRGEKGIQYPVFRKYFESPLICYIAIVNILMGLSALGYNIIIRLFLEQFASSTALFPILILGSMFYNARFVATNYFDATDQLKKRFVITLIIIGLNIILDVLMVKMGYDLMGIAWSSTFCFFLFFVIFNCYALKQITSSWLGGIKHTLCLLTCFCLTTWALCQCFDLGIEKIQPAGVNISGVVWGGAVFIFQSLIFSLFCYVLYGCVFYRYGVFKELHLSLLSVFRKKS